MRPNLKIIQKRDLPEQKIRHARLDRKKIGSSTTFNSEDQHSWAVSYSDLLMVLMSFFIIFFSFDQTKRDGALSEISVQLKNGSKFNTAASPATNYSKETGIAINTAGNSFNVTPVDAIMNSVSGSNMDRIRGVHFEKTDEMNRIVVHLSDDLYQPRAVDLSDKAKTELNLVLELLKPYANDLDLYFVGHTDPSPLTRKSVYLTNNFALASIRAVRAIDFAEQQGFAMDHLFTQGPGSNWRHTRSLSIIVQNRVALSH